MALGGAGWGASSLVPLLLGARIHHEGLMTSSKPNYIPRPQLQRSSHWGSGLQLMNLGKVGGAHNSPVLTWCFYPCRDFAISGTLIRTLCKMKSKWAEGPDGFPVNKGKELSWMDFAYLLCHLQFCSSLGFKSEVSLSDVLKLTISLQVRTRLFLLLQYAKPGTLGRRQWKTQHRVKASFLFLNYILAIAYALKNCNWTN